MQRLVSILLILAIVVVPIFSGGGIAASEAQGATEIHASDNATDGRDRSAAIPDCCDNATTGSHSANSACQFDCAALIGIGQLVPTFVIASADMRDVLANRQWMFFPVFHPPISA